MTKALMPYERGSLIEVAGGLDASPQAVAMALLGAKMIAVVDCSGSMSTRDAGPNADQERHETAQNCLSNLQQKFPGKIAIGAFNSDSHGLVPTGQLPPAAGGTPMFAAMSFFYPKAAQHGIKFCIISDGEPTDNKSGCIEMARQTKHPIYAIYTGPDGNQAGGKDFMRQLADQSGGQFDFVHLSKLHLLESNLTKYLTAVAGEVPDVVVSS
jgi:hypothetical protein